MNLQGSTDDLQGPCGAWGMLRGPMGNGIKGGVQEVRGGQVGRLGVNGVKGEV